MDRIGPTSAADLAVAAMWNAVQWAIEQKLLDSLPEEVSASCLLQRIDMLVAQIKTEKKQAYVAHTHSWGTRIRCPTARLKQKDADRCDSKDTGDRKDVTTNTQEHPLSLWRNEKAALSERVGNWMRHACAGITTLEKVANGKKRGVDQQWPRLHSVQRWLRLWCVDPFSRQERAGPTVHVFRFVECIFF